jgi:hypothetical protein
MSEFPPLRPEFELVILIGVLEHIRDLDAAMRRIRSVVLEQGLVYVEVPNALDFHRWPNAPFQDFSTEHINFFAPISLANLFARYGFELVFSKEHARDQAYRTTMSCLSAAFRVAQRPTDETRFDAQSRAAIERYVVASEAEEKRTADAIDALVESRKPLVVWGVGTNATRLLTKTRLAQANIQAFVDSNTKYHGKTLASRPIVAPSALAGRTETILILSRVFQTEIAQQIRDSFGDDREVMTLYHID